MKTYKLAMVPDKKGFGLGTLIKMGAVVGGAYAAYKALKGDNEDPEVVKSSAVSTAVGSAASKLAGLGVDKAAKEASDFASRVIRAAKKGAEDFKDSKTEE